ncbi:SDR family NAD(P)-dependent oxidoreductase [Jannaschia aquimarina]|uniref:CsgA_2 protein n=1 Tax=Jannaschia aquimarina TaxID=935700 RepID=A0A0D1E9Y9_9RHOB|nr:SDR family NAD(P)-dependent oxidoreductase [Jannaschia aquimarina]KIT14504.1 C-factor [Jannaschia aquimarina]SNT28440.1 Short-chain dehydrogenase [Jannaschia aquimarina]
MPNEARRALVIGASGGIGAALADALSRDHEVTRMSRSADGLDVADPESVARGLGAVEGPFDTVFVATGILAPEGASPEKALDQIDADAMARTFAVNAIGPAIVLRHLVPLLAEGARVGVLTARVGSIGDNRMGGWYSYRASKAAANQIVHGAAIEIGRKDKAAVIVALHPGTVETTFTEGYKAKKVTAEKAADNLIGVLSGLSPDQSGGFFDYAAKAIEW